MYGVVDVLSQWQIRHWVWGLYVEDSPVGIDRLQQVHRHNKPRLEAIVKMPKKMADHGCPTYDDSYFILYFILISWNLIPSAPTEGSSASVQDSLLRPGYSGAAQVVSYIYHFASNRMKSNSAPNFCPNGWASIPETVLWGGFFWYAFSCFSFFFSFLFFFFL